MSQTPAILDAVVARLATGFGRALAVELFPENPQAYRLNHPVGAILVAFSGSRFPDSDATDAVFQDRRIVLPLTFVFRKLNGPQGVVGYLDQIRASLTGWCPPHCTVPLAPSEETFLGQVNGLWQYAQKYATTTTQVQVVEPGDDPLLQEISFEDRS
ncbi:hypothetical protein H0A70_05155 [Alcaligenaceae bacterium]|nr:hypothetical protein [Alcaligenaceae bacterium]